MRGSMVLLALPFALMGCGGGSSSSGSSASAFTGPIAIHLGNAADSAGVIPEPATHVVVTISHIDARVDEDDWVTVLATPETVDLLALEGGTLANLGVAKLPAEEHTMLKLFINPAGPNYVTTADGVNHALALPPDDAAGVRVIGDLDERACATGQLTLDFAGRASIAVETDPSGVETWTLRPVLHLREVVTGCPDDDDHGNGKGIGEAKNDAKN